MPSPISRPHHRGRGRGGQRSHHRTRTFSDEGATRPSCRPRNDVFDWIYAAPLISGWRMGRGFIGRRRHRRSGHRKFDGVQFCIAHVGHDQPLIDPVDFLACVVDQLHHFGLRHALAAPRVTKVTRVQWNVRCGRFNSSFCLKNRHHIFEGFSHLLPVPTKSKAVWSFVRSAFSRVKRGARVPPAWAR